MKHYTLRPAIAMIELIFAITVIGITLLSVPLVISQATSSSTTALQQESIAMAASHMSAVLTYEWDEQNVGVNAGRILNVTSGDTDLQQQAGTLVRKGVTSFPNARRRQFVSSTTPFFATTTLGIDSDDNNATFGIDDIDDFNNRPLKLILSSNTLNDVDKGDYIDTNVTLTTTVVYNDDAATYSSTSNTGFAFSDPFGRTAVPTGSSTNIKHITVTLTSDNPNSDLQDKNITLHAFMCNIGSGIPASRSGF